ncbi:UNVERIFIED_CONTAM: protein dehydration-induced [Sesamum radiatum]|uniref:Protein dehydration-induced n=1 Tax=Sesamum radiatum TaxID=300843 RepID=A0AAW2S9P1_SESRA
MDSDSWARISTYSRRYQSRSDVFHGEEYEGEEEQRPEFLCPFCAEDFDIVGLCCHIDEEHAIEAKNGRRRRFRRGGSNLSFSILRKELREGNLQSFLGGSSFLVSSSRMEADPLLTSFMQKVVDEPSTVQPLPSNETTLMAAPSHEGLADRVFKQPPLSDEDLKEKAQRCKFVQGLVLSTFLDDGL